MYQKNKQLTIDDFILPFGGALSADNRWVIKSDLIPWDKIDGDYSDLFPDDSGNVAKPARNVSEGKNGEGKRRYGLNLIKEKLQETSEKTIMVNLIVMNLAYLYRCLFVFISKSGINVFRMLFLLPARRFLPAAA